TPIRRTTLSTQTISPTAPEQVKASAGPSFPTSKRPGFQILQPEITHTGALVQQLPVGLPKSTQSLCPECIKVISALIFEEDGKVIMEKTCPEHGYFRDIISSDVHLYL